MSEQKKKVYVGNGKVMKPNWVKISLQWEKLAEHVTEYNGKKYLRLNVNLLDEPDKYNNTASVTIDDFIPEKRND